MKTVRTIDGGDFRNYAETNYALVLDSAGAWPWYRRDYPEIRTLVELGWDEAWDYSQRER